MILKNSLLISLFMVLSVVLGIVRDRLLAQFVGIGQTLDILNASFRIPDLFLGVLFAFVASSTVIPFIAGSVEKNNTSELQERMSSLFFFFGAAMTLLSAIAVLILPYIAHIVVPGFGPLAEAEYVRYTRILMLQPILLGLSTLISTIAQARQRFLLYGLAPLIYTATIIFSILFYAQLGLAVIVYGVVAGALLHFLVQSIVLKKEKIQLRARYFRKAFVLEQLRFALPRSGSVVITQLRILFFTSFATTLGIGVLTIYVFAEKISDAALMVTARSLSTASLPVLAKDISQGKDKEYTAMIVKYAKLLLLVSSAIALAVITLRQYIVPLLYGLTTENTRIASFLLVLMLAFPFASINMYLSNALSAGKDTKTIFFANIIATPLAIGLALYLRQIGYGMYSLAIAVAAASILVTIFSFLLLVIKKYIYAY